MKEFTIASYRFGLDTRKDVLSSQPGTLAVCENAHINPGGEVEKRKTFDQYANVLILDGNGDTGVFGIEVTSAGILVFGSALPFGTTPTQAQPVLASAMPAGVSYQQLKHPTLYQDESYDRVYHRMTQLVFSENYNGNAFAAAKFADGNTFLYYNGSLVRESANGLVLDQADVDFQSVSLIQQLLELNWPVVLGVDNGFDELGAAQAGSTIVKSPESDYFTPIAVETSASGRIGIKNISQDGLPVVGAKAVAGFKIDVQTFAPSAANYSAGGAVTYSGLTIGATYKWTKGANDTNLVCGATTVIATGYFVALATTATGNGTPLAAVTSTLKSEDSGTYTLTAPATAAAASPTVELCGGAITATSVAIDTAVLIAQSVNDLSSVHGYTALVSGSSVFVYAPATFGAFTFNLTVTVTTGTVIAAGAAPAVLGGVIIPSPLEVNLVLSKNRTTTVKGDAKVEASGGTAPYTFLWAEVSPGLSGIAITQASGVTSANNASASFSKALGANINTRGNFKCTITDAVAATKILFLTVNLQTTYTAGQ